MRGSAESWVIAATSFGHALNNTGQEAGSIENITSGPGLPFGAVDYAVLSLPA